jgi:hypothetical protein
MRPDRIDDLIDKDSPVRVIDAFPHMTQEPSEVVNLRIL